MVRRRNKNLQFKLGVITGISVMVALIVFLIMLNQHRMVTYQHRNFNFKIDVPATWDIIENKDGAAVIFAAPQEGPLDVFKENVNIVVQDLTNLPQPKNLREYSKEAVFQMKATFKNFLEVEESEETTWGGQKAHKFVFSASADDLTLKYFMLWTLDGVMAYQFTYTAFSTGYDKYVEKVERMAQSFEIGGAE